MLSSLQQTSLWSDNISNLYLSLACIWGMVLEDLDRYNFIGTPFPTLGHLSECATPEELQHFITARHRAEDLVLYQLVVSFTVWAAALGGWCRVGNGLGRGANSSSASREGRRWQLLEDLNAPAATVSSRRPFGLLILPLHSIPLPAAGVEVRGLGGVGCTMGLSVAAGAVSSSNHHLATRGRREDQARGAEGERGSWVEAVGAVGFCFPCAALHLHLLHPTEGTGRHGWGGEDLQLRGHAWKRRLMFIYASPNLHPYVMSRAVSHVPNQKGGKNEKRFHFIWKNGLKKLRHSELRGYYCTFQQCLNFLQGSVFSPSLTNQLHRKTR